MPCICHWSDFICSSDQVTLYSTFKTVKCDLSWMSRQVTLSVYGGLWCNSSLASSDKFVAPLVMIDFGASKILNPRCVVSWTTRTKQNMSMLWNSIILAFLRSQHTTPQPSGLVSECPWPCTQRGGLSIKIYPGMCHWNGSQNQPPDIKMTPYSVQKLI